MKGTRSNRTHLAILLSVIGVGLPWHQMARAQGGTDGRTPSTQVESPQSSIRNVLGLNGASSRPRRAGVAHPAISRRANAPPLVVVSQERATSQWDAAALGLGRSTDAKVRSVDEATTAERMRGGQGGDADQPDIERMRTIFGLDREPVFAGGMAPLKDALRHPVVSSVATARAVDRATTAGTSPPPAARDSIPATAEADADTSSLVAAARAEPTDYASLIPDGAALGTGADWLSRAGEPALPRKRHEREPAPAITDSTPIVRRGGLVTTATLSLPPEDVESLDDTLRIRLRGQFRLLARTDTAPSSSTSMRDASTDDPLLALLQVLSNRDEDQGRPAPIIFVAGAPEDPRAAVISADVFRHVAEGIQHWSAEPSLAEVAADFAAEPPSTTASPGVAVATPAVIVARREQAPLIRTAMLEPTPSFVGGSRSREPMLPMNPFAWYGDDAIDLSVSLTGHPLLVALPATADVPTRSLQMAIARRRSPEPLPIVSRAMTDLVDIFDPKLALLAPVHALIARREPPVVPPMSHHAMIDFVDIFDPELTLARTGATRRESAAADSVDTPRRLRLVAASKTVPSGRDIDGERDTVVAAMDRQRTATPAWAGPPSRTRAPTDEVHDAPIIVREIEPQPTPQAAPALMFEADEKRMNALQGYRVALADSKLGEMRGGFETDGGLKVSFGIERAVYINGNLVTSTSLNVADLSRLTAGQAQTMGLDRSTLGIIQSGPNNMFSPGQLGASSVATVIQNTLNDQRIQGITQINATVNSLDLIRKSNIQQNIQSALADSIRH